MTAKRRLIPMSEVESVLDTFRKYGLPVGPVDIRTDGVTVHPPVESRGETEYDRWKAKDQSRDRPAHRQ